MSVDDALAVPAPRLDDAPGTAVHRELGQGLRLSDMAYRALRQLRQRGFFLRLPARWRLRANQASDYLFQRHEVQRLQRSIRPRNFQKIEMPDGERVTIPTVLLAEYFTASGVHRLYKALHKFGWDTPRRFTLDESGRDSLTSSRGGRGQTWWRIAELVHPSHNYPTMDGQRTRLPTGVRSIHLVGVSIGNGLTAVVAQFSLDNSVSDQLNRQLQFPHQPALIKLNGKRSVAQASKAVLHFQVQKTRAQVHHELRQWMTQTLPGAFAREGAPHPIFDVVFFDVANPLAAEPRAHRQNDALRAIGVDSQSSHLVMSPELPGLVLDQPSSRRGFSQISENVWTFWGNRSAEAALTEHTGNSGLSAAGFHAGDGSIDFIARTGLTALLHLLRRNASKAHDNARQLHGGMRNRDLKRLRDRTLTTSLDLARLREDVAIYNGGRWRDLEPQFFLDRSPWLKAREEAEGRKPSLNPIDINRGQRKEQKHLARELVAFDAEYREVLGTVASLGASLDSRRVQRIAVGISVASLAVAVATLGVTQQPLEDLKDSACAILGIFGWPTS